ncbi:MAG: hypothetical protein ACK5NG_12095 [Chthoniobacterales bacterium]
MGHPIVNQGGDRAGAIGGLTHAFATVLGADADKYERRHEAFRT